jgi:two-component system, chemotaxis family, sensor kinase Cph1
MAKKDEFMSIASHELKTPLTSVKASLQLLERMVNKNEGLESAAPFVAKAVKQTNKLSEIISDLLDVTRIQAGRLELFKSDFNLLEMIRESVEQFNFPENKHNIIIEGDAGLTIFADIKRIEQVLSNLLMNALKYSDANATVNIAFEKLDDESVRVAITDHGIGIPQDQIENIFDRFYRVENTSQNFSGVGLGLYISSEIIKQHHGKIGVSSTLGKGSTFWFII